MKGFLLKLTLTILFHMILYYQDPLIIERTREIMEIRRVPPDIDFFYDKELPVLVRFYYLFAVFIAVIMNKVIDFCVFYICQISQLVDWSILPICTISQKIK